MTNLPTPLAHCTSCRAYTFPAAAYGCRQCGAGAEQLTAATMPQTPVLRNFITVYGDIVPGLTPPFVVGEVELAPGVVEEALLAVADESLLQLGMRLEAVATDSSEPTREGLQFRPQSNTA